MDWAKRNMNNFNSQKKTKGIPEVEMMMKGGMRKRRWKEGLVVNISACLWQKFREMWEKMKS